ncbi:MAG: T9SS type A sorting domain-containing protein [Lentimicrobiaceae bacterium]|nr:T9SS type A sorting domain-containing protein [Lentimicrobiaceae bacterium]
MKKMFLLLITIVVSLSVFSQDFWSPLQTPNDENVHSIGVTKTGITFIGTSSGLYKSVDDGLNWTKIDLEIYNLFDLFIDKHDRIFVLVNDSNNLSYAVHYSLDEGDEFNKIQVPYEGYFYNSRVYANDSYIYVYSNDLVYKTSDFGVSWSNSCVYHFVEPKPGSTLSFRKMLENKNGELFLYSYVNEEPKRAVVFKSVDKGDTWNIIGEFRSDRHVIDMAFNSDETPYVICSDSLYYFNEIASVWESYSLPFRWGYSLAIDINDVIYITDDLDGSSIAKSIDGGENWEPITNNITQNSGLGNLYISPDGYLYVYNRLHKSTNKIFEPVQVEINTCSEFSVYPNPTTNIINISTEQFPNNEISSITITDISGREMNVNTVNNARIDISNLNEGTYIITVSAGNKVYRSKFLVMR